jgi:hypothetical protein
MGNDLGVVVKSTHYTTLITHKEKSMSNLTPFEIRLELLKMAKDMLESDYFGNREKISNEWSSKCEIARQHGHTEVPPHPGYPAYPSETDIIGKASTLNGFVSQVPHTTIEKTSKKST